MSIVALGGDGGDVGFVQHVGVHSSGGTRGIGDEGEGLGTIGARVFIGGWTATTSISSGAPSGGLNVRTTDVDTVGFGADSV